MNARKGLTQVLAGLPAKWPRIGYPAPDIGPANQPTLVYHQSDIKPAPGAPDGTYEITLVLHVLVVPLNEAVEDLLDDALEKVLAALDAAPWLTWPEATRSTYADKYTGYTIQITAYATKETTP